MYLEIPNSESPSSPSYKIPVKCVKTSKRGATVFYNKVLGMVAMRGYLKRKIMCFVHIPGHDETKARLRKGKK